MYKYKIDFDSLKRIYQRKIMKSKRSFWQKKTFPNAKRPWIRKLCIFNKSSNKNKQNDFNILEVQIRERMFKTKDDDFDQVWANLWSRVMTNQDYEQLLLWYQFYWWGIKWFI